MSPNSVILYRFSPNDAEKKWIESLPRADVSDAKAIVQPQPQRPRPSPKSPPPPPERVGTPASVSQSVATPLVNPQVVNDLRNQLAEEPRAVLSLQTENSRLKTTLTRLDEVQAGEWPNSSLLALLTGSESRCSRQGQSPSGGTGSLQVS